MKVSVVTACFNSEASIKKAIQSVNIQTYPYLEHIFVDGGSNDRTVEIIKSYSIREYKLISENDQGIFDAINKGIQLSTGDYIILLHSDDIFMDSQVIMKLTQEIASLTFPDILCGSVLHFDSSKSRFNTYVYRSVFFRYWYVYLGFMPSHTGTIVRRKLCEEFNYDPSFKSAGDFEWFLRVLQKEDLHYASTELVVTRQFLGGTSSSGWRSYLRSTKEQYIALQSNGLFSSYLLLFCRLPIKFIWRRFCQVTLRS